MKCHKYHHTLLHIEAGPKKEGVKTERTKVSRDMTYEAPTKRSEEVLLMTCRVEVMAPDGSGTQARALLDCAASTSLIMECFAKSCLYPGTAAT